MTTLSTNIRTLRKKNGLTQKDLADTCEVSSSAVSQWESPDKSVNPDLDKVKILSKLFNISIDDLCGSENPVSCTQKGAGIDTELMQVAFAALAINKKVYDAFIQHDSSTQAYIFSLFCVLCSTMNPHDLVADPRLFQAINLFKEP